MRPTRYPLAVIAGLTLVGGLAGCAAPASTGSVGPDAPAGDYADGTYTASGSYQAPSGTESVEVTVTLADNLVTGVEVIGGASNTQAKRYQGEFIDGIGAVVVGKNLNELQVDRVGGSSLTSGGFNAAIETIRADAAV